MNFHAFILKNPSNKLFIGFTQNLELTINFHNDNRSEKTKDQGPWDLVFTKTFDNKEETLEYNQMLRKQTTEYLYWLIDSGRNELVSN